MENEIRYVPGKIREPGITPAIENNGRHFRATMDITAQSEDSFIRFATHFLRNLGYEVVPPHEKWERPKDFNNRLHLCKHGLSRALSKYNAPICKVIRSKTGRILNVLSNAAFDEYCRRNCK